MAIVIDAPRVKNCGDCIGYYRCKGWTDEPFSCPIIGEIPDKHGRLIDADAIISKIERMVHPDDLTHTIAHGILKQIVEDAETIVEATE